jgi:hypothetical protein
VASCPRSAGRWLVCLVGNFRVARPVLARHLSIAMSHIDDVRRQSGVSNVYLGNKSPEDKSYRKRVPITAMDAR